MSKRSAKKLDVPLPLRITTSMQDEVKNAGKRLHMEDADALRLAATIGFKFLRIADYDVAGSIIGRAVKNAKKGKQ